MKKNYIIIPTYNDWKSLNKLIKNLNDNLGKSEYRTSVLIVNDCSLEKINLNLKNLKNIYNLNVINLKKNVGNQKAIFIGLKYLNKKLKKFSQSDIISVLDSDGEDDPRKLQKLIKIAEKKRDFFIFAYRSKRTESIFLKFLNKVRLIFSYILTGKYINFGNFSSFSSPILKHLLFNNNLYHAYSSGVLKNYKKIHFVKIDKNKRYYGKSKVNFKFLINHSIKIISLFYKIIFIRTLVLLIILLFISKNFWINLFLIFIFLIFNLAIIINYHLSKPSRSSFFYIKEVSFLKKYL